MTNMWAFLNISILFASLYLKTALVLYCTWHDVTEWILFKWIVFVLSTGGQCQWLGLQPWRARANCCYRQVFPDFYIIFTITQTFGPLNCRLWLVCILLTNVHLLRQESLVAVLSCSSSEVTEVEAPVPHVRRTPTSTAWMKLPLQWPLRCVTCCGRPVL